LHEHPVTIVPLLSGSGMRVKIIEAMALGPVVVSTTIGAEGIDIKEGHSILLADQPSKFADAVVSVLSNVSKFDQQSMNARMIVESRYDSTTLGSQLKTWFNTLMA